MATKRDKKLEAEMTAAMVLNMAKNVVDGNVVGKLPWRLSLAKLQARAVMNEKLFAERVIADDKEKRRLRKEINELCKALARACDLALDAADVVEEDAI